MPTFPADSLILLVFYKGSLVSDAAVLQLCNRTVHDQCCCVMTMFDADLAFAQCTPLTQLVSADVCFDTGMAHRPLQILRMRGLRARLLPAHLQQQQQDQQSSRRSLTTSSLPKGKLRAKEWQRLPRLMGQQQLRMRHK